MYKVCSHCLCTKSRSDFYKRSSRTDGYDYYCKQCRNKFSMRNVVENPMVCSVKDCTKPHYALSMCRNCYSRHTYRLKTRKQKAGRKR